MIKEVDLIPYPRKMWVAKRENFDKLKDIFELPDYDRDITDEEIRDNYNAIVCQVSKNDYKGYLVFIADDCKDSHLVHESVHVAIHIYEDCGMELKPEMDQEPLAYLIEYIYKELKEV